MSRHDIVSYNVNIITTLIESIGYPDSISHAVCALMITMQITLQS